MADTLESTGNYLPKDLRITAQPDAVDKDKFQLAATGLKIDSNYIFQFQYVFEDGKVSEWSPGYSLQTTTENVPGAPSVTIPSTATGGIPVTLSVFPANAKRVDIYVIGGEYGSGKVADYFLSAGTKVIPAVGGEYQISLITVTPSGVNGNPTNTFTTTVSNIVSEDTIAPDPIIAAAATAGPHPQDPSATLGYINLAITNATIPTDFDGYIVKIVGSTNSWTQEFKSKTALSNLYLTGGLFVGQSYSTSVATTDGKNISSYVNSTPSSIAITDNRTNNSSVVGSLSFSATDSILTVSWTSSTDPYVDSYRVQLTSNTDTTFASPLQTIYSKGTTATFGGLTANTTYRIRVTTKYSGSNGTLSTTHTEGTFTLDSSGAISDGVAPTTNPALTASMVKSLFGAFAITFPEVTNNDAVTYEVFIKPDNATGIVHPDYKVLEVGGTFAVIKTLANKTTALTYGADYYIAIRAKDNDGVSSGTVTAVGPVQTLQVANADLAADSVYANNIKAGEIDATKLTSDVILASQKITVGSNSALDRVRLDATNATISGQAVSSRIYIGGGNYYDLASPFYADNLGRLSIGQALKFEGNELTINGKGTFTGTVTAGTGTTVVLGNDVQGTNDGIYISATGDYIYSDGRVRLGNGGITYANNILTVSGNVTANSIASNTSLSGLSITGTTGTFSGSLSVGSGTLASITNASGNGSLVTFTAINSFEAGDIITISGIAQNQTLIGYSNPPTNTIPIYSYSNNPFNLGTVTVNTASTTSFTVLSGVTGTYTSGGTATGIPFRVSSTGILRAFAGNIGGWTINSTQIRSGGVNYISLNPITPKIALVQSGVEKITIDPIEGIKDSAGNFTLTPAGNFTVRGAITSGSTITGADITMTGAAGQTGIATTKLFFQSSNYAISAGASSYTYQGDSGYYDSEGDWVDTSAPQTITNNDIRFTDATYGGAVPTGTNYYYGELWLGSGNNSAGSVDLWANHPGGFIGVSLVANSDSKNIYVFGDSSAGFTTQHRSSTTDESKESPAFLQVDSAGRMSRGRAVITGGSSNPSTTLGLTGDLYFSTAT